MRTDYARSPEGARPCVVWAHRLHGAIEGLDTLSNGALLNAAEAAGFELLLTTDRRTRHQQNLQRRRVALVALTGTTWNCDISGE